MDEERSRRWEERTRRLFDRATVTTPDGMEMVTPAPDLRLLRHQRRTAFEGSVYRPIICLILQGAKEVVFAERTLCVRARELLIVSHDLPIVARVVRAPYVALLLDVDVDLVRTLHLELGPRAVKEPDGPALEVLAADARMLDATERLVAAAESPLDAKVLGPLARKEIHYRLLRSPIGGMLGNLAVHEHRAALVARAIETLRREFRSPVAVSDLAGSVGMSVSAFHRHFKAVTSHSPLQYQKELRLLEARRRLRVGATSVTATAFEVGYESLSQFSREYARRFGTSPRTDLACLAD